MKNIRSFFILIALCVAFAACDKDKGNYNYKSINELSILGFDTAKGYEVDLGQPLTINPQVKGTLDPDGTKGSYSYEWSLYFTAGDSLVSTDKNLNVKLALAPGAYTLQLKVKDNASSVTYALKTTLVISTSVFEGFMVLNEVNGASRLDMLSYSRSTTQFTQHTDVLKELNSQAPMQGKPVQVYCMESAYTGKTADTYEIYLFTTANAFRINPETFGYTPTNDFKNQVVGDVPAGLLPNHIECRLLGNSLPLTFFMANGNIYKRGTGAAAFPYVPINSYAGQGKPFTAYPELPAYFINGVVYNMDKRGFTLFSLSAESVTDLSSFPAGRDVVYMEHMNNGYAYAVLKDPGTTNYYMMSFITFFGSMGFFNPMNATDIDKATHFAVSADYSYLFYSVGGKVYEYDPYLNKSVLMLDKGAAVISSLSFQKFFTTSNAKYTAWGKLLMVGSYDPAGQEGSNGTLEQYSIPPANGLLQLLASWTGFGRITSISFRERS